MAGKAEIDNEPRLRTAIQLIRDRQPQAALKILDTALSTYDAARAGEKRRLYCGMSTTETLLYLAMAAKDKVDAVAVSADYCTALYLKGYVLIDLDRRAEAKAVYDRVIALAPMHAQYLTEYGQLVRLDKDWSRMLSFCEQAKGAAALGDPAIKSMQEGAALRCQGYALVEQKKWSEAEKRYKDAVGINPADAKAQGELRYIAEHRKE